MQSRFCRICALLALSIAFFDLPLGVGASTMYWTDGGSVERAGLDGSNRQTIYQTNISTGYVNYIAIEPTTQKLYYYGLIGDVNTGTPFVRRSSLDGNGMETLITGNISTLEYGFAVDAAHGKMYLGSHYGLWAANLDGSGLQEYLPVPHNAATNRMYPHGIAIDDANSKLYYTNALTGFGPGFYGVGRVDLQNGQNFELIVDTGNTGSTNVALDVPGNLLYYSTGNSTVGSGEIGSANLDGSNPQVLIPGITAYAIQLDVPNGKLYWTTLDGIMSSNLDGSGVHNILSLSVPGPWSADSLVLDLSEVPEPSCSTFLELGLSFVFANRRVWRQRRAKA